MNDDVPDAWRDIQGDEPTAFSPKKEPPDTPPTDCGVCNYHLRPTKECRRHAPHPGHDEDFVIALWNFTPDRGRCGAGSMKKKIVPCYDCTHWHLPDDKPLDPDYKQGLPNEWWENARLCMANPPGATSGEGLWTYWKVTSNYPINGLVGGCGDGISITAILEAAAKKKSKQPAMD